MPIDASQLKQRITEVLEAKAELKKLTIKPFSELTTSDKYAIRYQIIILAEALGSVCLHIAKKDLGQEPLSYADCFRVMDEEEVCSGAPKTSPQ